MKGPGNRAFRYGTKPARLVSQSADSGFVSPVRVVQEAWRLRDLNDELQLVGRRFDGESLERGRGRLRLLAPTLQFA